MLVPYHDTYRSTATGPVPALVLVHGWGMHSTVWDALMPALLERFEVTLIDLPGMGRSPLPGGDYSLDWLVEQVRQVAPATAYWGGWSLGAMVTARLASAYPDHVQGLIQFAATPSFVARADWPLGVNIEVLQAFAEMLEEDVQGTLIRFLSLQCKGSATLRDDIRQLRELLHFHGLPAPAALQGGLTLLLESDLRSEWAQLACPQLAVYGSADELVPVGVSNAVTQLCPQMQTAVIRGASHVPFLSAPELCAAAVADFMDKRR